MLNPEAIGALEREILLSFSEGLGFDDELENVGDEYLNSIMHNEDYIHATYDLMGELWVEILWTGPDAIDILGKRAAQGPNMDKADDIPFTVKPGFVSAWVNPARGTLSVEYSEMNNLTPKALGKKSLHMLEFPLFFEDIHRNVRDRIDAWRAQQ